MNEIITFTLVIALIVIQVIVLAVLLVLWRKYHKLKQLIDNHQASEDLERQRRSTDAKEDSKNSYIAGKRDSSTLVRSNSNESIVWVPTPTPTRKMKDDLNMTELTVVLTDETDHQDNTGFVNEHFASSPTKEAAIKRATAGTTDTTGSLNCEATASLKVRSAGSHIHGVTAGTKRRIAGSTIHKTAAEPKTDGATTNTQNHRETAETKAGTASTRNNIQTADTRTAGSQHQTATAVPLIHVQQPNAGANDGYYDDEDDIYENQEAVRTLNNNNNSRCRVENMDNIVNEDRVVESHVTQSQPIDEPIYVNRDIIEQFRC